MHALKLNTMTSREIPPLPTSLIPMEVAPPPPTTTQRRPPTPISSISTEETEDVDELVVESGGEPVDVQETTVALVDGDGAAVNEDEVSDAPPLTADLLNNTMSLKQLKDRCVELGLVATGKKMDLAERIVASQS